MLSILIGHLPHLAAAAAALLCARKLLHYFQLESYQFYGLYKTFTRQWKVAVLPTAVLGIFAYLLYLAAKVICSDSGLFVKFIVFFVCSLIILALGYVCSKYMQKGKEKKPFVMTARMKRLYIILGIVVLIFCWITPAHILLLPLLVALAALIALPVEKSINRMYMKDAQRRMNEQPDLIRIGITGSYGKTSVKNILYTILSQK